MRSTILLIPVALLCMNVRGQKMDRTKPPQTPDLPVYKLPAVSQTTLPNGLEVILVEDRRFPLVTARLGFNAGAKYDPKELRGLSETTAALLSEGTKTRSARQIAEESAAIGGAVRADSSADSLVLAGNALAEHLPKLLNLMSDVARNANFPEDEVALRKENRKQELEAQRAQASYLADEKMAEVVFGSHPYARQEPTPESIDKLDRGALAGFRDKYLVPNNGGILILLGSLPPRKQVMDLITAEFGNWQKKEVPAAPAGDFPEPKPSIVLVDRPGSVQADIRIAQLAVDRSNPDYFPLLVGNSILGGGMTSRIFQNIREKEGYAYDAHSALRPLKDRGALSVVTQVRNEVIEPALKLALKEMKTIGTEPVSAEELSTAKNYLSGVFVIRLETQDGLASQLSATRLMGLPLEYLETYTARVRSVEPDQIKSVSQKYANPDKASIVVVGDASKIRGDLEKFGNVKVEKAE
jgi:zinc protease